MKNIGPTFGNELKVAGLFGLQFSWTSDGQLTFGASITDEQKQAILAVYTAHDPSAVDLDALKSASQATAESYIFQFFSLLQLQDLMLILLLPTSTSQQQQRISSILQWARNIRGEAILNYTNPDFIKFGQPPFTYESCIN